MFLENFSCRLVELLQFLIREKDESISSSFSALRYFFLFGKVEEICFVRFAAYNGGSGEMPDAVGVAAAAATVATVTTTTTTASTITGADYWFLSLFKTP